MDRVAQLEESIEVLLKIMAASVSYISRKASHRQILPDVSIWAPNGHAASELIDDATMRENTTELAEDLVKKSKVIELLISNLPETFSSEDEQALELAQMDAEIKESNEQFRKTLQEAGELRHNVEKTLLALCDTHHAAMLAEGNAHFDTNTHHQ